MRTQRTKTLICRVIMKKAFMHIKKGCPFVPIVSITFDHIPRKSACHSVCLWEKMKDVHICRSWTAQHNKANILCLHLMFLFSELLLMLELISFFFLLLDIHNGRLSGCVFAGIKSTRQWDTCCISLLVILNFYCLIKVLKIVRMVGTVTISFFSFS